ncbi:hypothetical protein TW95_gp1374 [Pandoravirus inopinatum]|uniref:Uncharacterized protein n=1 Tax=Pandoravirus inopinatum TaxID=1605721 RepID=A0A0B5IZ06_9VIRU|nr:hypothetical protein TW95_gp1374 [Pandoravirus inopinatum]AJF98108.1 hypothetical protein [Pandoravirus inopinatum]
MSQARRVGWRSRRPDAPIHYFFLLHRQTIAGEKRWSSFFGIVSVVLAPLFFSDKRPRPAPPAALSNRTRHGQAARLHTRKAHKACLLRHNQKSIIPSEKEEAEQEKGKQ